MSRPPDMLHTAARAAALLQADDAAAVVQFLRSCIEPNGGFRGRAPGSDIYYTVFGAACLLALGRPPNPLSLRRHLESFDEGDGLDFIHLASLARLWAGMPLAFGRARTFLPRLEAHRAADGGYNPDAAGAAHGTVYGGFVAYLTHAESGVPLPRPEAMLDAQEALRTPDGGFANAPGVARATTTATAAALLLQRWIADADDPRANAALRACECRTGGFLATPEARLPDLLSTATALYALRTASGRVSHVAAHLDFVEALWEEDGGFCGHPADPISDCEYTFYALLAMGACASDYG